MSDFNENSRMNTTLNEEYNNAFLQYQGIINFAAGNFSQWFRGISLAKPSKSYYKPRHHLYITTLGDYYEMVSF